MVRPPTAAGAGRPRLGALPSLSIRTHAVLAAAALLVGASAATAVLVGGSVSDRLNESAALDARTTGERLAEQLAGALESRQEDWADEVRRALDSCAADRRVRFAAVSDDRGSRLDSEIRDAQAWAGYLASSRGPEERGAGLRMATPIDDDGRSLGVVYRAPIWSRSEPSALLGYATVAIHDPGLARVRESLWRVSIAGAFGATLLAAPVVLLAVRSLTRPLQRVARSAESLASGERPEPLAVRGPREIATLARTFNDMARRLDVARRSLEEVNRGLEDEVARRTAQLRESNDLLRVELAEKSEFVRSVSHDLRAPLRNIEGMIDLILRREGASLPADAVEWLERIRTSAAIEQKMLEDLLDLTRIGLAPENRERVDSLEVALEVARSFEHDVRQRGIEIIVREPMPTLLVERARLRQAIQNLVDNAIKYMGGSAVRRIEISGGHNALGGVISVADTGPGIPYEEQGQIFNIFRRGSSAGPETGGSGVGLASVRAVVDRWSGEILLASEPGKGSRFLLTLPPERVAEQAVAAA